MAVYVYDPVNGYPKELLVSGTLVTYETSGTYTIEGTGGGISFVWTEDSVQGDGSLGDPVKLVNDQASPGNNKVYGTDSTGVKGWQDFPPDMITGSGVAGQIAVFTDPDSVAGYPALTFDPLTNEVDLSAIQFNLLPAPAIVNAEGKLWWNSDDGTLNLGMPGGNVVLQIGQELLIKVKNDTGGTLNNGDLVYISGATGDNVRVSKAIATSEATSDTTIAMMTEQVLNNQHGYATAFGLVRDLNTNAYAAGTLLFLSASVAGEWTNTEPTPPNHNVPIGIVVRQNATQGIIFVRIRPGFELSELHDVVLTTPADGELLTYNGATNLWENSNKVEVDLEERIWFRAR